MRYTTVGRSVMALAAGLLLSALAAGCAEASCQSDGVTFELGQQWTCADGDSLPCDEGAAGSEG